MKCRHCQADLSLPMLDLGSAPPSNAYLSAEALHRPEKWFPLRVLVCESCWLAQTEDFADAAELFSEDYAYFSGFSRSWLEHSERYVAAMADMLALSSASHVVEVAANDGYLLQYVKARGIPCTGIEPTASTATAARAKGLDIVEAFFGETLALQMAADGRRADLMTANNVLAHVPDINSFIRGFTILLKPQGVATFEFPHLMQLIAGRQFDTVYHEHFSYLCLLAVDRMFRANGLEVFDVAELPTHGGSLRVFAQKQEGGARPRSKRVAELMDRERQFGLEQAATYRQFQRQAEAVKNGFLGFLLEARRNGKRVAAYGAAAKGNTLMNFAGVRPDLISYVVDKNPAKAGKFMPGSRIPIVGEEQLAASKPDYVVILPWNLKTEVSTQLGYISNWGGRLAVAVPEMEVL